MTRGVDIAALHDAILADLAAAFPEMSTVADYRESRTHLPLPAILVELADMEGAPEDDPGTEQVALRARFVARVVIGFRTDAAEREIRRLATALAARAHLNRWGQTVGPAEVLLVAPDEFAPELAQFVIWSVEWQQIVHAGESVWKHDAALPQTTLYSHEPCIGIPFEPDYRPVCPPEDGEDKP